MLHPDSAFRSRFTFSLLVVGFGFGGVPACQSSGIESTADAAQDGDDATALDAQDGGDLGDAATAEAGQCAQELPLGACFNLIGGQPESPDEYTELFDVRGVVMEVGSGRGVGPCEHFQVGRLKGVAESETAWLRLGDEEAELTITIGVPDYPVERLLGRTVRVQAESWSHEYEGSSHEFVIQDTDDAVLLWIGVGQGNWTPLEVSLGAEQCHFAERYGDEPLLFAQHYLDVKSSDGELVRIGVGERALVDDCWWATNGITSINYESPIEDLHVSERVWAIGQRLERSDCDAPSRSAEPLADAGVQDSGADAAAPALDAGNGQ